MIGKGQIKEIQSLQLKKFRDSKRLFIAEGVKNTLEILNSSSELIVKLFASADFIKAHKNLLENLNVSATEVSPEELKKISLQSNPNQVLTVCRYLHESAPAFDFQSNFTLFLDDIRDPGNFGTIIRLADWYGLGTVFCTPESCDLYNPKVIQASMGAFLRIRVVYRPLKNLCANYPIKNVYGAVLRGKSLYDQTLKPGLIVIGNEANGISEDNLSLISEPLTIPSHNTSGAESLNAAMAASIITSEFFRQLQKS